MPVTMEDVARIAGVSKSTVSRIINGIDGRASDETAATVHRIIQELGYVPNRVAANLKKKRTMNISLVLADIVNPFFAQIAQGVEDTLKFSGYSLILANTGNDPEHELHQIRVLIEQQVDAIIIASSFHDQCNHLDDALARGIKIVLVNNMIENIHLDTIIVDNFNGAYQATRHLIELGHRCIGMITGPAKVYSSIERKNGYIAALNDAGIEIIDDLICEGNFRVESGDILTRELIQLTTPPTAIFASNNLMAVGALQALRDLKVRIPDDISFISFDDLDWYSLTVPPITAVRQPSYQIGATATQRLLESLKLDDNQVSVPEIITLNTEMIVRESTAHCPS